MIEVHDARTDNGVRYQIYPTHNCITVASDYSGEHDVDLYEEDLVEILEALRSKKK